MFKGLISLQNAALRVNPSASPFLRNPGVRASIFDLDTNAEMLIAALTDPEVEQRSDGFEALCTSVANQAFETADAINVISANMDMVPTAAINIIHLAKLQNDNLTAARKSLEALTIYKPEEPAVSAETITAARSATGAQSYEEMASYLFDSTKMNQKTGFEEIHVPQSLKKILRQREAIKAFRQVVRMPVATTKKRIAKGVNRAFRRTLKLSMPVYVGAEHIKRAVTAAQRAWVQKLKTGRFAFGAIGSADLSFSADDLREMKKIADKEGNKQLSEYLSKAKNDKELLSTMRKHVTTKSVEEVARGETKYCTYSFRVTQRPTTAGSPFRLHFAFRLNQTGKNKLLGAWVAGSEATIKAKMGTPQARHEHSVVRIMDALEATQETLDNRLSGRGDELAWKFGTVRDGQVIFSMRIDRTFDIILNDEDANDEINKKNEDDFRAELAEEFGDAEFAKEVGLSSPSKSIEEQTRAMMDTARKVTRNLFGSKSMAERTSQNIAGSYAGIEHKSVTQIKKRTATTYQFGYVITWNIDLDEVQPRNIVQAAHDIAGSLGRGAYSNEKEQKDLNLFIEKYGSQKRKRETGERAQKRASHLLADKITRILDNEALYDFPDEIAETLSAIRTDLQNLNYGPGHVAHVLPYRINQLAEEHKISASADGSIFASISTDVLKAHLTANLPYGRGKVNIQRAVGYPYGIQAMPTREALISLFCKQAERTGGVTTREDGSSVSWYAVSMITENYPGYNLNKTYVGTGGCTLEVSANADCVTLSIST